MHIGLIGFGHLGKALVSGLLKSGVHQDEILINTRTEKTKKEVSSMYPTITVIANKEDFVNAADVIVLAVEPKNAKIVLDEIKNYNILNKIMISFMAGIQIATIRKMLEDDKGKYPIIRMMPNLAIAHCNGLIGFTSEYDNAELANVLSAFHKLGDLIQLEEEQLEYVTIIGASGLAFAAYMMKAYKSTCQKLIGDEDISNRVTMKVFENAMDMVDKENISFDELINLIATEGGTTEVGIKALEKSEMEKIMINSFCSAYDHINKRKN